MPYSTTTLSVFRDGIARRLDDPNYVFWSQAELTRYINEALATWQTFSSYWQEKGHFLTTPNEGWYEVPTVLELGNTGLLLLGYAIDDRTLYNDIAYALLEPPVTSWGSPWAGTEQFSFIKLLEQLQQGKDTFLRDSGLILTKTEIDVTQGVVEVPMPQDYLEVSRVSWISFPNPGDPSIRRFDPMRATSRLSIQSYTDPLTPGQPYAYEEFLSAQPSLYVYPASNDLGKIELFYVGSGEVLDPGSQSTPLRIPYNSHWMVKYAALDCLLQSDGQTRDAFRAEYCKQRFEDAMVALRNLPAILAAQINGYPAMVYPIVYKDSGPNPTWRDDSGYPREVLVTGWNYVYITPTPTTTPEIPNGVYDVELFVARNAPILTADANTLDIDNSLLPMIEDFVCHLALFKTSGAEFMKSVGAYENLIKTAMDYNSYLKAHSRELSIMKRKSTENKNAADARRVDETEGG